MTSSTLVVTRTRSGSALKCLQRWSKLLKSDAHRESLPSTTIEQINYINADATGEIRWSSGIRRPILEQGKFTSGLGTMPFDADQPWCQIQDLVDRLVHQTTGKHLSDVEIQVLRGAWEGQTYEAIAQDCHLTVKYVGEVGGRLWQLLSQALSEEVKKTNFRQALFRYGQQTHLLALAEPLNETLADPSSTIAMQLIGPVVEPVVGPIGPAGLPGLRGDRWIERTPLEQNCHSEITKPGALLRLKAPLQFGKTLLMSQILQLVSAQGYRTVALNLRDAVREDFGSLTVFLQWFLASLISALELPVSLETHWQKSLGNSKIKCRTFFEKNILPTDQPLVIALDEVDRLFAHSDIAGEFLGMLRTWHEDAKTKPIWGQLRMLVVYTEVYTQMDINQSPFNAGLEVPLSEFNTAQIHQLAQAYGLDWTEADQQALMDLVGGQPYLVDRALGAIAQTTQSLSQLLATATHPDSPYRNHLERQWRNLHSNPHLMEPFKAILMAHEPYHLSPGLDEAIKLYDLGLIQLQGNQAIPRYPLYQRYFSERWGLDP
jgi:hypothetical protein